METTGGISISRFNNRNLHGATSGDERRRKRGSYRRRVEHTFTTHREAVQEARERRNEHQWAFDLGQMQAFLDQCYANQQEEIRQREEMYANCQRREWNLYPSCLQAQQETTFLEACYPNYPRHNYPPCYPQPPFHPAPSTGLSHYYTWKPGWFLHSTSGWSSILDAFIHGSTALRGEYLFFTFLVFLSALS